MLLKNVIEHKFYLEYLEEYVTEQENNTKIKEINLKKEKEYLVEKNTLVKKIDDLQEVITALKEKNLDMPLQFVNMKS